MQNNKNMITRKVIVIGAVGAGKSSLLGAFKGSNSEAKKTQSIIYDAQTIDTPGEYMENPTMYRYIIATAQNVEFVVFLQDSTQRRCIYPPGFAQSFNGISIGVVTKIDDEKADVEYAKKNLISLCIKGPIFETSSKSGYGIKELIKYLKI